MDSPADGNREAATAAARPGSIWAPLGRSATFRRLWLASVVSNVGTWMQNVGAVWLMATLTPDPLMVALVQTATSLPVFFLALPGGALADVVDRRKLLVATQLWMLVAAAALGVLAVARAMTAWRLLALTFAIGVGGAINAPGWQAIMPELVSRADLPAAIALNGVGVNIARAIGPALGGLVIVAAGVGSVFLLNAVSFLAVVAALVAWRRPATVGGPALPAEHVVSAMRTGLRFVRWAPPLRAVLVRTALFVVAAAAPWALVPIVARDRLGLGAGGFGGLLACLGAGAVLGAVALPRLRAAMAVDRLAAWATIAFAVATVGLAWAPHAAVAGGAMVVAGVGWMTIMATFNVGAQVAAPAWVRARALGVYMLVFQGAMAGGSALWGAVAARAGTPAALVASAVVLVAGLGGAGRWGLAEAEAVDVTPSLHWAEPAVAVEPDPDDGPVLVTVEYRIDPRRADDFRRAARGLARVRRRDGALRWRLFRDPADPARYVECFLVRSWAEHLRQHDRVTVGDRPVEDRVRAFQLDGTAVRVDHLVDAGARDRPQ